MGRLQTILSFGPSLYMFIASLAQCMGSSQISVCERRLALTILYPCMISTLRFESNRVDGGVDSTQRPYRVSAPNTILSALCLKWLQEKSRGSPEGTATHITGSSQ